MDSPASQRSSGTVTFLFSDIQGSTRLLQELGDAYTDLLARHHALVREAITAWRGNVIDTAGDGFFVAFQRAGDAVGGAVAIQRSIASAEWPHGRTVHVRIGLHTGEPTLSAEGYIGLDVHRAARIGDAAAGGQVLLSATTRNLAGTDLPPGVTVRDLGTHALRDLHEPEHLFQLVIEGLRSEFPPLDTVGTKRANFPAIATRLIARQAEVGAIGAALARPEVRLVTLTGPGGTGKTRLALAAADAYADIPEHGAVFVPLASLADAELVPAAIARALDLVEDAGRPTIDVVIAQLRRRDMLLVLDNFEQVIAAAPFVAQLLAACPRVCAIVTSRVVLRLSGEHELPVAPLPLPELAADDSAAALLDNPAIALFVERARAVRPDFRFDDENAPAVAELCVRLDGLPLALELAAARIRIFSPHALLARLGNRLDLLKGGARDMPERHKTLRGAIAWSYELLEPAEQALFRRLAVFSAGFTLDAAEEICGAAGPLGVDVFDGVAGLVERSLVRREAEVHDEPRFGMLDTIRQFGLECLEQSGEARVTRSAHARFFLSVAEAAAPRLAGPDQQRWLDRIEADIDNMRAAFDGFDADDATSRLRLGAALYRFWVSRGHLREGRERLEQCLVRPGAETPSAARVAALSALANITHELAFFDRARPLVNESLAISRELGDEHGIANSSTVLAWITMMMGDHAAARVIAEEALELHRRIGSRRGEALLLHNLGIIDYFLGELVMARAWFEQAIALIRDLGDRRALAYFVIDRALVDKEEGRWTECARHIDESVTSLVMLKDTQLTGWGLTNKGVLQLDCGDAGPARRTFDEALDRWRQVGNRFGVGWTLLHRGLAELDEGEVERGDASTREAIDVLTETGSPRSRAAALAARGELLTHTGRLAEAAPLLAESLTTLGSNRELPTLRRTLDVAAFHLETIDAEHAARLLDASTAILLRSGAVRPPRRLGHAEALIARLERAGVRTSDAGLADTTLDIADVVAGASRALESAFSAARTRR